jgi:hypothetical protein
MLLGKCKENQFLFSKFSGLHPTPLFKSGDQPQEKTLTTRPVNKKNLNKDLPPFVTRQSHERYTLLRVRQQSSILALFL